MQLPRNIRDTATTECACDVCVSMCKHHPCRPTPEEAEKLIQAGYGDRLMIDYWLADRHTTDIYYLVPAIIGHENTVANYSLFYGTCTFLKNDRCELHDLGLKPLEGRIAYHDDLIDGQTVHRRVVRTWKSKLGYQLVEDFRRKL